MKRRDLYTGRRFRDALRAFLFGRALQGVANIVLLLLVVRILDGSDYGAYMALWGILEMLVPLSSLGLLEAVRRFLPDLATRGSSANLRAFVRWTTLVRLVILLAWAGAIALAWPTFAPWIGLSPAQVEQTWLVVVLVVTVLFFRYAAEMLEALLEQLWAQVGHALLPVGRLVGIGTLVATDSVSLEALLWVDIAVSLVCLVLAEWALLRRLQNLNVTGEHRVTAGEVGAFAWHMAGANLLQATASDGALRLLAARLLGLEAMGLYAFLQQVLSIVNRYMPAQLLANMIRPMLIARLAKGETVVVSQAIGLMWKSNVLVVLAGIAVTLIGGDVFVRLASGGRFDDAAVVLLLLFVGLGASSQGMLINMAMQIHDRTSALRAQSLLFLLVPAAAWAGGQTGLTGFVIGVVAARWLRNGFALWWMKRNGVSVLLDLGGVMRAVVYIGLAVGPLWFLGGHLNAAEALLVPITLVVLAFLLARPLSMVDEQILVRILQGKARFLRLLVKASN